MKSKVLIFILIGIAALSCKKDKTSNQPVDDGKLYPVNFTVNGFIQQHEPITNSSGKKLTADTPLKALAQRIYYRVYKPDGTLVKSRRNTNYTLADFNKFKDSLTVGNYIAVFLAYDKSHGGYSVGGNGPDDLFTFTARETTPMEALIFYKKISFTVTSSGSNSSTIALERVNAGLQLKITDAVPAGVTYIAASYQDYNGFQVFNNKPIPNWDPNDEHFWGSIDHGMSTAATPGQTNTTSAVWPYILNTVTPITVTIRANGFQKTVYNVMFYRNTTTILTGKLFTNEPSGAGNAGFQTTFKTAFDTDSIIKNF
ncbi:hypothetical protein LJ707_15135 [Mucilaginibacter sp. UR6-1]|nr:hypothetical protein [Mucilaginibacter sp. UR6-1]MCC8410274.1 hypothetical protein [Mucilaginibacter sp. UR6-1]